jgi:hypothetical protein
MLSLTVGTELPIHDVLVGSPARTAFYLGRQAVTHASTHSSGLQVC